MLFELKNFALVLWLFWSIAADPNDEIFDVPDVCASEFKWYVKAALYANENLILITSDDQTYHLRNFKYENEKLSYDSVNFSSLFQTWAKKSELKFLFRYEGSVIGITYEEIDYIRSFVGYKLELDPDMTRILNYSKFNLNYFIHTPTDGSTDDLNLVSMITKFPEDNPDTSFKSIVNFPITEYNLPKRLFVYYLEKVSNNSQKDPHNYFKRHIMIQNVSNFGDIIEKNWHHDQNSGNCIDEPIVMNTSVCLNDYYDTLEKEFTFNLMEFYGSEYVIKRVRLNKQRVYEELITLETGPIKDLLKCQQLDTKTSVKLNWFQIVMTFIVVIFSVTILLVLYLIINSLLKIRIFRKRFNEKSRSKSPSKRSSKRIKTIETEKGSTLQSSQT